MKTYIYLRNTNNFYVPKIQMFNKQRFRGPIKMRTFRNYPNVQQKDSGVQKKIYGGPKKSIRTYLKRSGLLLQDVQISSLDCYPDVQL